MLHVHYTSINKFKASILSIKWLTEYGILIELTMCSCFFNAISNINNFVGLQIWVMIKGVKISH